MLDGKRGTAQQSYTMLSSKIEKATGNDALEVFETAMDNVIPVLEVRARACWCVKLSPQLKFVQKTWL